MEIFGRLFTLTTMSLISFLAGWAFAERWQVMNDTPTWWRISAAIMAGLIGLGLKLGWIR